MDGKQKKDLIIQEFLFNFAECELEQHELENFRIYLDRFSDVNAINGKGRDGDTLLHVAVRNRNLEVIKMLIDRGANVDAENNEKDTPLRIAERLGKEGTEILNLLSNETSIMQSEVVQMEAEIEEINLNVDEDDIDDVKRKMVKPSTRRIEYLNNSRILHRFLEKEKYEIVYFLLEVDGIDVRLEINDGTTLADIAWSKKRYQLLVILLDKDSDFPKGFDSNKIDYSLEGAKDLNNLITVRERLHKSIESGDLELVKKFSKEIKSKACLDLKNRSALATSLKERRMDVYAFLLSIGMEFINNEPVATPTKELKRHLEKYFRRDNSSPLHKILSSYKVCGESTEDTSNAFHGMFQRMFRSRFFLPMLKVLQYENFEIIFDINSEITERICFNNVCARGLTAFKINRCYIGAKNCSSTPVKETEVFSTLVHEICHLTVNFLYENNGLPYRWNEDDRKKKYQRTVELVDNNIKQAMEISREEKFENLYEIFVEMRKLYKGEESWEKEVIARCSEFLALYGDDVGEDMLQEYVPELIKFYENDFVVDCERYFEDAFYVKPVSLPYEMSLNHGCLSKDERENLPFVKIPFTFEDYLLPTDEWDNFRQQNTCTYSDKNLNVFLLRTDNVYLCKMHVYRELKDKYKFHVDRKCLFFEYNYFYENLTCIRNALNSESFEEVIIVQQNETSYDLNKLMRSFKLLTCKDEKRAVIIVNKTFESSNLKRNGQLVSYDWDLVSNYWKKRLGQKEIIFQGKHIQIDKLFGPDVDKKLITSQLISKIMEGVPIGDDGYRKSEQYVEDLFIERHFVRKYLDNFREQFETTTDLFFVTGIDKNDLISLGFPKDRIKNWARGICESIEKPCILLPSTIDNGLEILRIICEDASGDNAVHFIHYFKMKFYLWKSLGKASKSLESCEDVIHWDQLMTMLQKEKIIVIADDPGTGKSTILTKLGKLLKDNFPSTWVSRITLKELFSNIEKIDDVKNGLGVINAENFSTFFINAIVKNDLADGDLLKVLIREPNRVSIFLDGFDELGTEHRNNAIHFIKELRKNTKAAICLTSRIAQSEDLIVALETVSYSFRLWDKSDQCNYLGKFWRKSLLDRGLSKAKDKILRIVESAKRHKNDKEKETYDFAIQLEKLALDEDSTISNISSFSKALENVDFLKVADRLMTKSPFDSKFSFLGIPLHVNIFGSLFYMNDFEFVRCSNSFNLFSNFFGRKVEVFLKEKAILNYETEFGKMIAEKVKKEIGEIHKEIAKCNLGFVDLHSPSLENEQFRPHLNDIGLVKMTGNETITFFHKTCEEYLLAASVLDDMIRGKPDGKIITKILLYPDLNNVRRFLNGPLEDQMPTKRLERDFFADFCLVENFKSYIAGVNEEQANNCKKIWEYVIVNLESQSDELLVEDFIFNSKVIMKDLTYYSYGIVFGLRVFLMFSKEKWISRIFDFKDSFFGTVILRSFDVCSLNELIAMFVNMEIHITVDSNYQQDMLSNFFVINSSDIAKEELKNELLEVLFEAKDVYGRNMLFIASENNDVRVFHQTLSFLKNAFGERCKELLFQVDKYRKHFLSFLTRKGPVHFRLICEHLKSEFQNKPFEEMTIDNGRSDLWETVRSSTETKLIEDLKFLKNVVDKNFFVNRLLKENSFGMTILNYALRCGYEDKFFILLKEVRNSIDYNSDLEKSKFFDWLKRKQLDEYNIATIAVIYTDPLKTKAFFEQFRKILNDDKCFCTILFEGILLCYNFPFDFKNKYNDNALMVLDYLSELISEDRFYVDKMADSRDATYGRNFVFLAVRFLVINKAECFFMKLKTILDVTKLRKLYLEINKEGNTILHYACLNYDYGIFRLVFDEVVGIWNWEKEHLKKMIIYPDKFGNNLFHLVKLSMKNIDELQNLKDYVGEEKMKELMLREGYRGETCLHRLRYEDYIDPLTLAVNILIISKWLNKEDFEKLTLTKNFEGHNFYYYLRLNSRENDLLEMVKLLKKNLSDESFRKLMNDEQLEASVETTPETEAKSSNKICVVS